jgi:hypothetical protein
MDGAQQPCWKICDCWWETFDVVGFLQQQMTPEAFRRITEARPKPKLTSIVEAIENARARMGTDGRCAPRKDSK